MVLKIEKEDNRFRVITQDFSLDWLPDTAENRKVCVVFLRLFEDSNGKPLFTLQQLAEIVDSNNRQAASQHVEDFRACGEDFHALVVRRRKVDFSIVELVEDILMKEPFTCVSEIKEQVSEQLGRDDLSEANIHAAMEQVSCKALLPRIKEQIEKGEAHYKESYLLAEMMETLSTEPGERADLETSNDSSMELSDPTEIRKLVTPNTPLSYLDDNLKGVVFILNLYYWGVPLSRLGQWLGVHKTTILRWIIALALSLWPIIFSWIIKSVNGSIVYIDEKWIKIRGKWHYWFVVLDAETQIPIVASLLKRRTSWACRWIGVKLRLIGKIPKVIVTDGLPGYKNILPAVKHQLCIFHHQQGVTRWLKEHFQEKEKIQLCKAIMKKVFQTNDKRTALRRLRNLSQKAKDLQIEEWINNTTKNLPSLLGAIGSKRIPRTNNCMERFFRAFNRFYKIRCGFHSIQSTKRELILFMVVYLFTKRDDGKAPLEAIIPDLSSMPLYKLMNNPFGTLLRIETVKKYQKMADNKQIKELVA